MNRFALPLLVLLGLAVPAASFAGGPPSRPPRPSIAKKVWTSEEVEALRAKGLISLLGQEPVAEVAAGEQAPLDKVTPRVPRPVRAQDPEWYHEQVSTSEAVIAATNTQIHGLQRELHDARYWEAGVNLRKENTGITPESALQIFEARNHSESEKIDALRDQARRNHIPPGAIR